MIKIEYKLKNLSILTHKTMNQFNSKNELFDFNNYYKFFKFQIQNLM